MKENNTLNRIIFGVMLNLLREVFTDVIEDPSLYDYLIMQIKQNPEVYQKYVDITKEHATVIRSLILYRTVIDPNKNTIN